MATLRPIGTVRLEIGGGVVDMLRFANLPKQTESWLALNYDNAAKLGLALIEAAELGRSFDDRR